MSRQFARAHAADHPRLRPVERRREKSHRTPRKMRSAVRRRSPSSAGSWIATDTVGGLFASEVPVDVASVMSSPGARAVDGLEDRDEMSSLTSVQRYHTPARGTNVQVMRLTVSQPGLDLAEGFGTRCAHPWIWFSSRGRPLLDIRRRNTSDAGF